ncbi:hypothetical protein L208DRAFT_1330235, partial [Tricholoma matsutake]
DTLNGCLCRSVLNSSLSGVIKCKQAGCETQWYHLQCNWSKSHKIGCAWLVRHPGKDTGESTNDNDVIFPYLDMFLIM